MSILIINGQPATLAQSAFSAFHGASVFTTLRSRGQKLLLWERHWHRVTAHARAFGYAIPDEQCISEQLMGIVKTVSCDQRIRIIIAEHGYALTAEAYAPPPSFIYDGVKTVLSRYVIHPQLGAYKTANSLPYQLAYKEAQEQGAFEALLLDSAGFLVDGSRTSLLCFDGKTLTALKGGLDGCMRDEVLAFASQFLEIDFRRYKPKEVHGQLLLANSLMGLVPVNAIYFDEVAMLVDNFRMDRENASTLYNER